MWQFSSVDDFSWNYLKTHLDGAFSSGAYVRQKIHNNRFTEEVAKVDQKKSVKMWENEQKDDKNAKKQSRKSTLFILLNIFQALTHFAFLMVFDHMFSLILKHLYIILKSFLQF